MKVPVTVIGFGLVVVGSAIFGQLRANYLRRISDEISVDSSKQIILRYAIWVYVVPLLALVLGVMMAWGASHSPFPKAVLIYKIICVISFLGGIFALYRFATGRVTIFEGKLTYTEGGDRWEVSADDVRRFSFNGLTFLVKRRSDRITRIPATFQHSEIILAFLKQAAVNK
jgi:Positive regulator of sigma(E), RseC/MucC